MFDMPHLGAECFTKLSNVAVLNPSLDEKPAPDEVVSFVPMAALSAETASVVREAARPYAEVAKGYTAFQSGDLLVAKITPCFENNKIGYASISQHLGFGSTEFHVVRPNAERLDTRYLLHFLRQDHVRAEGERRMTGSAGQRRVPENFLANLIVPVPSIAEQRRIAAILDQADALRAKRRAALARLDEMGRAIFDEMFFANGVQSQGWPQVCIGDLASNIRTGPFGSQLLHSEFVEAGVAVLGIDNAVMNEFAWGERRYITTEKYKQLSRYKVSSKDVIVTIMGTCGRAAVVPEDIPLAITTKHLCSITLDVERCLPEYLHACFLLHPSVLKQLGVTARGAVMPGLNMGLIKDTVMPLPPLPLQSEFCRRSAEAATLRQHFRASLEKLDALFTSLQHRAFRGEL